MTSEEGSFFFISLMWKSEACGFSFQPEMKKREIIFLTGTMGIEQPSASVALAALFFWHSRQQKNCRYFAAGHEYGYIPIYYFPRTFFLRFFSLRTFFLHTFSLRSWSDQRLELCWWLQDSTNHYSSSVCDYRITSGVLPFCLWLQDYLLSATNDTIIFVIKVLLAYIQDY